MATISLTEIKTSLHSIRWKILIAYLLIISVAFFVIGYSSLQLVGEYLFNQRVKEDQRIADSFSEQIRGAFEARRSDQMYNSALEMCADSGSRMLVLDRWGVVQVDTFSEMNGTRFSNTEAAGVLAGGDSGYGFYNAGERDGFWSGSLSLFSDGDAMTGIFASAIRGDAGVTGAVIYISQVQDIFESLSEIQGKILTWLLVVAAAVILMTFFIMRSITRPITELREGITRMSGGDFSARVDVRGRNEFAELAAAFNSMSSRLQQLDSSRTQFVSDASHELKTPLSTMKLMIENLLYQDPIDPAMAKEFLGDVNREIDRLNRTISDLLTLVGVERREMQLSRDDPDIGQLLLEQVRRLAPLARENGIEMDLDVQDDLVVAGDRLKLEQVFYNILDNAIKYTPRGGEVACSVVRSGRRAVISVSDTGIGIPSGDLPHIFERFYRVDKARSRATGGTGLGLSIVNQIIQLHGGTIRAASEEGRGTTFTIELPLAARKDQ